MMLSSSSHKGKIIVASCKVWLQQLQQQQQPRHRFFSSSYLGSSTVRTTRTQQRLILQPILDKPYRPNNHNSMYFATWAVAATVSSVSAATFDKQSLMPQHHNSPPTSPSPSPLQQQVPTTTDLFPQLDIQLLLPSSKKSSATDAIIATSTALDEDETSATATTRTTTLYPNSVEPIEFESSLFKGKVLLLFPTTETDGESEAVEKKEQADGAKNTKLMEIQIQGKFKQPPKGTVYFGIQLVDNQRMNQLACWKKG